MFEILDSQLLLLIHMYCSIRASDFLLFIVIHRFLHLLECFFLWFQLLKEGEITPGITSEEYVSRRKKLLELLPEKSLAIVAAAQVNMMNEVVPYNFRQDADYFYITGCQQPGGIAVLGHDFGLCMFMPEPNPQVCLTFFNNILWYASHFLLIP